MIRSSRRQPCANVYKATITFQVNANSAPVTTLPFYYNGLKREAKTAIRQQFNNSHISNDSYLFVKVNTIEKVS